MEVIITFTAALSKEMISEARRINQCKSFAKLCFRVEDIDSHGVHDNKVGSFSCESFGVVNEHSSSNWDKVFSYEVVDNLVKVTVADGYKLGPIIPGYQ